MIKACIFDLDGTLLDTLETITYYVNRTLEKYGVEHISCEECRKIVGNGAKLLIERAFLLRGVTDSATVSQALDFYKLDYDTEPLYLTRIYDGVEKMLCALKNNGIKLAVLSNKPDTAVCGIIEHFFPKTFDAVSGGKDDLPLKPDPKTALMSAAALGVLPSECAFIGDTGVDMTTGVNMGAALKIGVSWGFRDVEDMLLSGADTVVDFADEILTEVLSGA